LFYNNEKNYIFVFYRPTATELLKHPIFKKAKDKKYLQSTLIAIGPSLETRVQKVGLYLFKIIISSLKVSNIKVILSFVCCNRHQKDNQVHLADYTEQ